MPYFDVFSPSRARDVRDVSLTLEAANWMMALRGFLTGLGQDPGELQGMMCDARADGSFVLTFPSSNRWFRIQPSDHSGPSQQHIGDHDEDHETRSQDEIVTADRLELKPITAELARRAEAAAHDKVEAPAARTATEAPRPISMPDALLPSSTPEPPQAASAEEPEGEEVPQRQLHDTAPLPALALNETTEPVIDPSPPEPPTMPEATDIKPPSVTPTETPPVEPAQGAKTTTRTSVQVEQILEEIFERSSDFFSAEVNIDLVVSMFLDLAMEKIPSQAGAFYAADISGHDLQYAALRSPRARKVLASGKRVTIGEGVAGLCAQENITLCINDLPRYPDLHDDVAFMSGMESRSTVCVSLEREGRCYGAIQLVNRLAEDGYDQDDVSILEAIAHHVSEILARAAA
ncbi:MAG: GAF domain-containing protein [Pseudomonadota bacterium]